MKPYRIELCTGDIELALKASTSIDQVEFCDDLKHDGLTPKCEDIIFLKQRLDIPIKAMVRNHFNGFVYNVEDMQIMMRQADALLEAGADRLVFGASEIDGRLSMPHIAQMAKHIFPVKLCIHKAIDLSPAMLEDLKFLMEIDNVVEVLTSGGQATAMQGRQTLKEMVALAGNKIDIIAAGKITYENLEDVHAMIQAPIYHGQKIIKIK